MADPVPYSSDNDSSYGGSHHASNAPAWTSDGQGGDNQTPSMLNTSWPSLAEIGRRFAMGTRDVVEGVAGLPTMAADVATWPGRAIQRAVGIPTDAPSTLVQKGLNATGLPTPQTPGEQATSTAVRGGAAMLPFMGAGFIPGGANIVRSAVPVVSGGVGAEVGKQASDLPYVPEALKPSVDLAGNILGGGLTTAGVSMADRLYNAFAGNTSDIANAFKTLNIKPGTVSQVSGGPFSRGAEATFSGVPPGQAVLQPVAKNTVQQFGNAVDDTASQLHFNATGNAGVVPNASTAGNVAQTAIRDWRYNDQNPNSFVATQDRLYQPVNTAMAGKMVSPEPYRAALEAAVNNPDLAGLASTQEAFAASRGRLQKMLTSINDDAKPGQMITWGQAQAIRRELGEIMGTPAFQQDIPQQAASSVYAGIAKSLEQAADGQGVGDQFRAANGYSTSGYNFINRVASKAVTTNNPAQDIAGSIAADNLLKLPDEAIQELRQRVPQAADALGAYNLRTMANAKPSVATAPNETSVGTFLTNQNRMQTESPGAYRALYGDDPNVAKNMSAMGTVGDQMRRVAEQANASKTAYTNYLMGLVTSGIGGTLAGGPLAGAGAIAAPLLGPYLGAKAMTNPTLIRLMSAKPGPRSMPGLPGLLGGSISATPGLQQDDIPTVNVHAPRSLLSQ